MTNHVHLLITPHDVQSLPKAMQMLGHYYVQYFNNTYHRTGTLWEGRYKPTLIDTETYLLICMRYIEQNPVRAKMVAHAFDYAWSSYHHNALGKEDALLTEHPEYQRLGKTEDACRAAYRDLFVQLIAEQNMNEIRDVTNKAWVMGAEAFKARVKNQLERRA